MLVLFLSLGGSMATFRKRVGKWQARVQRQGQPALSKTFISKQDAELWARKIESEIDLGFDFVSPKTVKITNHELLTRYLLEITPKKKGADAEHYRIKRILRDESLCNYLSVKTSSQHIATYRDKRLKQVSSTTVRLELAVISHAFNTAIKEWGFKLVNPVALIKLPKPNKGRSRRLSVEEYENLLLSLDCNPRNNDGTYPKNTCRNAWMKPLVILAVETAMRQSELLQLKWIDVNLSHSLIMLHDTKNGDARCIPLTKLAVSTLELLKNEDPKLVFPHTASAVKQAFVRAVTRANLEDFHFHDLRHEATSRLAEKLINVLELSAVTGHKDLRVLKRYYHPRIEDLINKINN